MANVTNGKVGRTITETWCSCSRIVEEKGERKTEFFTERLFGSYNIERAARELRRRMHDSTINVLECETTSHYRSMSLETFIQYSEETERE